MEKYKVLIIISIGFICLVYNILSSNLILSLFNSDSLILTNLGSGNYLEEIFKIIIRLIFNIEYNDINSYSRLFGGNL